MTSPPRELPSLPEHRDRSPDLAGYRLRVDGLVQRPLALTTDELRALGVDALTDDFTCLEGWTVPELHWRGVRLGRLLDAAGVRDGARWVLVRAVDMSLPLALDEARASFLALDLEGAPLTGAHGAPVRLLVPGGDCFTSLKWLESVEVLSEQPAGTARDIALARLPPQAREAPPPSK